MGTDMRVDMRIGGDEGRWRLSNGDRHEGRHEDWWR